MKEEIAEHFLCLRQVLFCIRLSCWKPYIQCPVSTNCFPAYWSISPDVTNFQVSNRLRPSKWNLSTPKVYNSDIRELIGRHGFASHVVSRSCLLNHIQRKIFLFRVNKTSYLAGLLYSLVYSIGYVLFYNFLVLFFSIVAREIVFS